MTQLTIVAKIKAKPDAQELVYQELQNLTKVTQEEEGCINYDLHRSIEDSSLFVFYENWTSKEVWEKHMQSEHIKGFQKSTGDAIEALEIFQLVPDKI